MSTTSNMASNIGNPNDSSDSDTNEKGLDFRNVDHTMSDESSKSDKKDSDSEGKPKRFRRVRKIIVEKRPRSSSEDSDKENKKVHASNNHHSDGDVVDENNDETVVEPLYQNQMEDPRVQSLLWHQYHDGEYFFVTLLSPCKV